MAFHLRIDAVADLDPAFHFDVDPDPAYHADPTFQFDADPDPQHREKVTCDVTCYPKLLVLFT
jgi:hypothetical protein